MCSLETFPGKKRRQFILLSGMDKKTTSERLKIMTEIFRIKEHKWKSITYFSLQNTGIKEFTASKFISVLPVPDAEERAGIRHAISKG